VLPFEDAQWPTGRKEEKHHGGKLVVDVVQNLPAPAAEHALQHARRY